MKWALDNGIGGGFTWDTSLDDFNGQFCNEGKFPLITSAIDTLTNTVSSTTTAQASSTSSATSAASSTTTTLGKTSGAMTTSSATTISTTAVVLTKPLTKYESPSAFCGSNIGFYPHPLDCSKYIECGAQSQVVGSCPGGLLFNAILKLCDW